MAEVLDIIHKLSYDVDPGGIHSVSQEFNKQIAQLAVLQKTLASLESQYKKTGFTQLNKEIANTKKQIDELTTSIGKEYVANEKLQEQFQQQIGTINELGSRERELIRLRNASTDPKRISEYNKQLLNVRSQMISLNRATVSSITGVSQLEFAGAQLLREAPAFTYSIQTGILALSNNIPILVDQIRAAQAAGQTATQIFRTLGSAIFGVTGLITLAVSVFTIFGDKIFSSSKSVESLAKESDNLTESLVKQIDALNKYNKDLSNSVDNGTDAIKRNIDIVKAKGVVDGEVFEQNRKIFDEEQNLRKKQLQDLEKDLRTYEQAQIAVNNLGGAGALLMPSSGVRTTGPSGSTTISREVIDVVKKIQDEAKKSGVDFNDALIQRQKELTEQIKENSNQIESENIEFTSKIREQEYQLSVQLFDKIRSLRDEQNKLRIADEIETSKKIRSEIDIERDIALSSLDKEIETARKNGILSTSIQALFSRQRQLIISNANIEFENTNRDFLRRLVVQEQEFNISMQRMAVEAAQTRLKLLQDDEMDTLNARLRISELSTRLALDENSKAYDAALEQARLLGEDTSTITQNYLEKQAQITAEGINNNTKAFEEAYKDRVNIIRIYGRYETEAIQDTANDVISYYLTQYENDDISYRAYRSKKLKAQYEADTASLQQQLRTQERELTEAEEFERKISSVEGVSDADRSAASNRTVQARSSVSRTRGQIADRGNVSGFQRFVLGDAAYSMDIEQRRIEVINSVADAYSDLATTAVNAYGMILEAQQNALDREVSIRQQRVQMALEIADRGNTEALKQEQEALNASVEEQRKAAITQQAINSALTISNALVAVAKAAAQGGGFGSIAAVLAVIGALATGYAAVQSFSNANNNQFWTGGFTPEGGKYQPVGTVHAGEFVANQETTKKYRRELAAMHNGTYPLMPAQPKIFSGGDGYATKGELIGIAAKLDGVTEAIEGLSFRAENRVDGSGVNQLVETQVKIRQRQWRR
jgi:hypothetical protein